MTARSELGRRTIVGLVAAAVAIGAVAAGGLLLWAVVTALAVAALAEWGPLVGADRVRFALGLLVLGVALVVASPMMWGTDRSTVALLVILSLLTMLVPRTGAMAAGTTYVGLAAIGLLFLRAQADGVALTCWTLLIVWATDIAAYFAGRRIGGAKLAPRLSPNKTWAGLIGGAIAAAIVGGAFATLTRLSPGALWLGAPLAIVAQGGDLFESWLKRRAGVKDSGVLLPGHGGVLDRVDGLLPVAILVAALVANGTF